MSKFTKEERREFKNATKITHLVTQLQAKKVLEIRGVEIYLFRELWKEKTSAEIFMKNLFIYMRVHKKLEAHEVLNFIDKISGDLIGSYSLAGAQVFG